MAERICLLTGYETTCNDGCYNCGCGGEVAFNNFYVPIYNVQRVCDIVKGFECTSIEGEKIAEYIRNELEKMTVCIEKKAADVQPVDRWISVKDRLPEENQKCLVYRNIDADLKITTGIWHSEWKAFDGLRHGTRLEDTIAWMPLPEPPNE